MNDTQETPLYRFKDNVGYVLADLTNGPSIIEVGNAHFIIAGLGTHPDNLQPTYVGQIASGPHDGVFWFLEPGWIDKIEHWATIA